MTKMEHQPVVNALEPDFAEDQSDFRFVLIETITDQGSVYAVHIAMLNPDETLDYIRTEPFEVRATSVDALRDALVDILELFDNIDNGQGQSLKLKVEGDTIQLVTDDEVPETLPA